MRKLLYSVFALTLLGGAAFTQDPDPDGPGKLEITVEDPAKLPKGAYAEFTVKTAIKSGDKVDWEVQPAPLRAKRYGTVFVVDGIEGTTYTLKVQVINLNGGKSARWDKGTVQYTFGGKKPDDPIDPVDPTPKTESPFKDLGFRALYLYEKDDLSKYTLPQYSALYDNDALTYLNSKTVTLTDGSHEWRKWDKDVDVTNESKVWQDAVSRAKQKYTEWETKNARDVADWNLKNPNMLKTARAGLPWLMVGDGKTGWEGPIETPEQALDILKKIGK